MHENIQPWSLAASKCLPLPISSHFQYPTSLQNLGYSYTPPHYNTISISHASTESNILSSQSPQAKRGQTLSHLTVRIRVSELTYQTYRVCSTKGIKPIFQWMSLRIPSYGITPWQESNILSKQKTCSKAPYNVL